MKKVLVIGATGAMGRHLVPELAKLGYQVTGVSLGCAGKPRARRHLLHRRLL